MFNLLTFLPYKLKGCEPVYHNFGKNVCLDSVSVLGLSSCKYSTNTLYVSTAAKVSQLFAINPESASKLYFIAPANESERSELALLGGHYIFLRSDSDIYSVFNELQATTIRQLKWEILFERILYNHGSVQDVAEISKPYISGLTLVWNGNYNLVSLPGDDVDDELQYLIPHIRGGQFTHACVESTLDYGKVRSYDIDGVKELDIPNAGKLFCLVRHIFKAGNHAYTIALINKDRSALDNSLPVILYYFSKLETLLLSNTEGSAADNVFESFLRSIVDGSAGDNSVVLDRAKELGLPIYDEYLFYVVRLKDFSITRARFFIESLRQTLPYEPVIIYKEHICILKRTNIPKCKTHNGQMSFEIHLENYDAVCGISRKLNSLLDCRNAYYQACVALAYGILDPVKKDDMPRVFYYKDYTYYHMIELYERTTGNINSLLPGNIQAFYSENRNDNECMDMISAYIRNGMSSTATATELCVHRNTVINRINRIKEDYSIDLKKHDALFGIQLMLMIRRYNSVFRSSNK